MLKLCFTGFNGSKICDEKLVVVKADGHAFYDNPGKDIVCAAVSVLLQTLEYSLQFDERYAKGLVSKREPFAIEFSTEYVNLSALNTAESYFVFCYNGLKLLESNYPDNIEIILQGK